MAKGFQGSSISVHTFGTERRPVHRLPLTVGFARVSQATEDRGNLETQTQQLQEYGVHELVTEIGSGAGRSRRARRDLQSRLQAGDTLVVTAIDRISRRAVDGLRFIKDVTDAGVHLVVLSQREFDTTTPTGQLLLHLTLAIAEWEWSNIRQRSIQGQERARAEGKRIGALRCSLPRHGRGGAEAPRGAVGQPHRPGPPRPPQRDPQGGPGVG